MNLNEIIEFLEPMMGFWIEPIKDPLILAGFTLFILAGIIKRFKPEKLTQKSTYVLFNKGLNFIFILSLLMVTLGFSLKFMQSSNQNQPPFKPLDLNEFIEHSLNSDTSNTITHAGRDATVQTTLSSQNPANTITQAGRDARVKVDYSSPHAILQQNGNTITQAGRDAKVNITNEYQAIFQKSSDYKSLLKAYNTALKNLKKYPDDIEMQQESRINTENLQQFKRDVIKLAQDFDKIPLNTERLKQAKIAFDAGDFDKARKVLNEEAMIKDQNRLLEEQSKIDQYEQKLNTALENNAAALKLRDQLADKESY